MKHEWTENPILNGANAMKQFYKNLLPVALVIFLLSISNASAMTIMTRFVGGTPPANTTGYGNLNDIVTAAARIWESAYADPIVVTLYYGWAPVGDAGNHTAIEMDSQGKREISGMLMFDNSGATPFYLDPTPYANEEYRQQSNAYENLGGGLINSARILRNPSGQALGHVDLLSVVLHEIGHAMGISASNLSFVSQSKMGIIQISENLPYAGTIVPIAYNNSGIVAHFDVTELAYGCLMGGINSDERRLPSELDILTNAQISGYTIQNLNPQVAIGSYRALQSPSLRKPSNMTGINRPATW
jgi:hypothetical protein